MTYSLQIAWRYFFSKSQQTVINRINAFAFFMVVISTASLFVVLSAFAGLKNFGLSFSEAFDPDFEIQPLSGKYFNVTQRALFKIESLPEVIAAVPEIEEKVFLSYKDKNQVAYLKAIPAEYSKVIKANDLVVLGNWLTFKGSEVVLGFGIAGKMSIGVFDYNSFLNISVPKKKKSSILNQNPFNSNPAIVTGLYQVSEDLDKKYVFSSLSFGQELLELPKNKYTSIVLKTFSQVNKETLLKKIAPYLEGPIRLISREEQNLALHKMLNVENLMIYFIFTLVMIIALFNVVGALIMMVLDKKGQMKILMAIGAQPKGIYKIFFNLGLMICGFGGFIGVLLGGSLVLLQSVFPFIYVPGTYMAYPVFFEFKNILIVFLTLFILGLISTAWATRGLTKKVRDYAVS